MRVSLISSLVINARDTQVQNGYSLLFYIARKYVFVQQLKAKSQLPICTGTDKRNVTHRTLDCPFDLVSTLG